MINDQIFGNLRSIDCLQLNYYNYLIDVTSIYYRLDKIENNFLLKNRGPYNIWIYEKNDEYKDSIKISINNIDMSIYLCKLDKHNYSYRNIPKDELFKFLYLFEKYDKMLIMR